MDIMNIGKIIETSRRIANGDSYWTDLTIPMNVSIPDLEDLFTWTGILDAAGNLGFGVLSQDIIHVIGLYYAMRPTVDFRKTVFRNHGHNKSSHS